MNIQQKTTFEISVVGKVTLIEFSGGHYSNPFSTARQIELTNIINELSANKKVGAIIFYGGEKRYFSAGGDFKEVCNFKGGKDSDLWLEATLNLFKAVLAAPIPIISAIDGHCIGFGLQLALVTDYRIVSKTASLSMPELKVGIACINGTYMLEHTIGRMRMQKLIWECGHWNGEQAYKHGLVHNVVEPESLLDQAKELATKISTYESAAIGVTKLIMNTEFSSGLSNIFEQAKSSHRITFSNGTAQKNMKLLLNKKKQG